MPGHLIRRPPIDELYDLVVTVHLYTDDISMKLKRKRCLSHIQVPKPGGRINSVHARGSTKAFAWVGVAANIERLAFLQVLDHFCASWPNRCCSVDAVILPEVAVQRPCLFHDCIPDIDIVAQMLCSNDIVGNERICYAPRDTKRKMLSIIDRLTQLSMASVSTLR